MAATATMTVRMEPELKREASEVAKHFGTDLSAVMRMVCTQMVNTYSIPVRFDYEQPNEESRQAIRETKEIFASRKTHGFKSADEMIEALGI